MLRVLALCCWSVFADAAGMAVSAACQIFSPMSSFVTITLSEAEGAWGECRELACSVRSVTLVLPVGMAESSQDMRRAAIACGLAGLGNGAGRVCY